MAASGQAMTKALAHCRMKSWRRPRLSQVTISVTIATIIDDMVAARMKRALLSIACPGAVRSQRFRLKWRCGSRPRIPKVHHKRVVSIEESLTGLPAFCADVAWRALVSHRLRCPPDPGRMRSGLHAIWRRARAVAARGGGRLPQLGHRQGEPRYRQNLADRRPRHVRRGLSAEGVGA